MRIFFILFSFCLISCKSTKNLKIPVTAFSANELQLIRADSDSSSMRIFQLSNTNDSILLRSKSSYLKPNPNDKDQQLLMAKMQKTLTSALGVGIAAPQVGILKNLICVQRFDKEGFPFEMYFNPVIKQYSKKTQPCQEGCLSIADKQGNSDKRAYAILLEYDKPDGSHEIEMVEDFTAVIFQHEIDHLHGILFIDHLEAESDN